jgi:hypothetical protein
MMISRSFVIGVVAGSLLNCAAYAQGQRTSIGVLTCTSGAGIEGKRAADNLDMMTCGFKPTGSGAEQRYSGTLKVAGQAAPAPEGKRVWVWSVTGPASPGAPSGVLAQKYVADPRGMSGPVMVLVGESNDAITLQAETSGGTPARIMEVELKLLTTPA